MNERQCSWCFEPLKNSAYINDDELTLIFCTIQCSQSYHEFEGQFDQGDE